MVTEGDNDAIDIRDRTDGIYEIESVTSPFVVLSLMWLPSELTQQHEVAKL